MARSADRVGPLHAGWLANAARRGVPDETVERIARAGVGPAGFGVLSGLTQITDPYGKTYFQIRAGTPAVQLRAAVLLAYVFNAGTGYPGGDFAATAYGAAEVVRIRERQRRNAWSYRAAAPVAAGGALAATPHGILIGVGGTRAQRRFSRRGGTTYGDVFLLNLGGGADPAARLRAVVESGVGWYDVAGVPRRGHLHLDRLLHHEERHARQWAALGPARMGPAYLLAEARAVLTGRPNSFEVDAGLTDGGYR